MFEDFFRVHVRGVDGKTVVMDKTNVDYQVAGGTLRVIGLSDLGKAANADDGIHYDDCYQEDRDNQIDIILAGDATAARNVENVEIPSLDGDYRAFYNPGGPGPEPFQDVHYTAPGPQDLEPVTIALDDPMRVSRDAQSADPPFWKFVVVFTVAIGLVFAMFVMFRRWMRHRRAERSAR
jgi:hypothetical protein